MHGMGGGVLFSLSHTTRRHPLKLSTGRVRVDQRKHFCIQHVISLRNSLLQNAGVAPGPLKRGGDGLMEGKVNHGFQATPVDLPLTFPLPAGPITSWAKRGMAASCSQPLKKSERRYFGPTGCP